jgi:hypothetical protein
MTPQQERIMAAFASAVQRRPDRHVTLRAAILRLPELKAAAAAAPGPVRTLFITLLQASGGSRIIPAYASSH